MFENGMELGAPTSKRVVAWSAEIDGAWLNGLSSCLLIERCRYQSHKQQTLESALACSTGRPMPCEGNLVDEVVGYQSITNKDRKITRRTPHLMWLTHWYKHAINNQIINYY